jgi:hypothetical protein
MRLGHSPNAAVNLEIEKDFTKFTELTTASGFLERYALVIRRD